MIHKNDMKEELPDPTECGNCATPISRGDFGRPRKYCSDACRQSAYRARQ